VLASDNTHWTFKFSKNERPSRPRMVYMRFYHAGWPISTTFFSQQQSRATEFHSHQFVDTNAGILLVCRFSDSASVPCLLP
jgi:hypothetical protein